jgi:putative restriction endonuclease
MFAIAPTDHDWFERMRDGPIGRIVNFWTPTPWNVKGLQPGDRLYFMLKAPVRKIGGFGTFIRYADMSASDAWVTYGLGNGVDSHNQLVKKIEQFAQKRSQNYVSTSNPTIGCIELSDVVTLDNDLFFSPDKFGHSFPRQVVKLKYFTAADNFAPTFDISSSPVLPFALITGKAKYKPSRRKDRPGQSIFREEILKNYLYQCCVTGEGVVELLEASHIQPFIDIRSNHSQNGLCLRVDLHRLFDEGLITITEQNTLVVSKKLAGTSYADMKGAAVHVPKDASKYPSQTALQFHRAEVFR